MLACVFFGAGFQIETFQNTFISRGMGEETAASMKTMVGFSLGADFGLDFQKKARLFKGYISQNLGVPVSSSSESIRLGERTIEIKYDGTNGCGPVAITAYQLVDNYTLFRADGTFVDSWQVVSDREPQEDLYPLECGNTVEIKMIDEKLYQ